MNTKHPTAGARDAVADGEKFADWLAREMPPGTTISNPYWWAPRIIRALAALASKADGGHGHAAASDDLATKEVLVPCDCGCGRKCCAMCGNDLGFIAEHAPAASGMGDAKAVKSDAPKEWWGTKLTRKERAMWVVGYNQALAAQPAPGVGGDDAEDAKRWRYLRDNLPHEFSYEKGFVRWYLPRRAGGFMSLQEHIDFGLSAIRFNNAEQPTPRPAELVDEEMTRLMEIHGVSDLPALVRMLLRFNENLRSRQRPDPEIPQRAPREG